MCNTIETEGQRLNARYALRNFMEGVSGWGESAEAANGNGNKEAWIMRRSQNHKNI